MENESGGSGEVKQEGQLQVGSDMTMAWTRGLAVQMESNDEIQ